MYEKTFGAKPNAKLRLLIQVKLFFLTEEHFVRNQAIYRS